jgi:uncharacterized protein (DUF433 family)
VIRASQLGTTVSELEHHFVTPLTPDDIQAAMDYYRAHKAEIDEDMRLNEEA